MDDDDDDELGLVVKAFQEQLQDLPNPSDVTPSNNESLVVSNLKQCHGCGKDFAKEQLLRCTRCKRVYYCSKSCQLQDHKKPRSHKKSCRQELLSLAMNNLRRIPVEEKMAHNFSGRQDKIPNAHFNQTVAKMSCANVSEFLACVKREYPLIRNNLIVKNFKEASHYPGNCQKDLIDVERFGVDLGVESLCAAINLWPGVYTINSCSGLHEGAWVQNGPGSFVCTNFVQFVSDDCMALNNIQAVAERGGFGIKFEATKIDGKSDPIGNQDGFVVIDCELDDVGEGDNHPRQCRTYGRVIDWAPPSFDKLDCFLWHILREGPPLLRMQNHLLGFLGVAFQLVRANPSLNFTDHEMKQLNEMEKHIRLMRKAQIQNTCEMWRDSCQGTDELSQAFRKALSDMHLRVTAESSLLDSIRENSRILE